MRTSNRRVILLIALGVFALGVLIWQSRRNPRERESSHDARTGKWTALRAQAFADNNVPVSFWGKIVDQNGTPISGVRVSMTVRHWQFSVESGPAASHLKFEAKTDAEGKFQLTGAQGDSLRLEAVEREGYRLSPKAPKGFLYGDIPKAFLPDPNAPVVIRMWKVGPAAPLVSCNTLFGFTPDGHRYTLDLLSNKKAEGEQQNGDLIVSMERPAKVVPRQKYPWTLRLRAIGGGLIETKDEFMYQAPESGYQPEIVLQMDPQKPDWAGVVTKDFYIRSRDGAAFGALHLRIRPKYNEESAIFVEARMNPTGSPNLQP